MTITDNATTATIRPKGKITAVNAEEFRKSLQSSIEGGIQNLTIDLAEIEMIDSKGLAVFIMCHQSLASRGGSLTVITANDDMQQLFRVMRLDRHFTVRSA